MSMKHVLFVVPFKNLYPPMNGGVQRSFHLLHQLSLHVRVTAIIGQDKTSFSRAFTEYPALKNIHLLSTKDARPPADLFNLLPARLSQALRYRYWNRSLNGPAGNDFLSIYPVLHKLLKEQSFDYAILEDISLLNLAKVLRRQQPSIRIIYDAHNVNTRLAGNAFLNKQIPEKEYRSIHAAESSLSDLVTSVFTCSEQDLGQLSGMNHGKLSGLVVPNGVRIKPDATARKLSPADRDNILFCGSLDYMPNREGISWFCRKVFPLIRRELPSACLMVVGKGDPGDEVRGLLETEGINYYGAVEDVTGYYNKAALAVVPLLSGSGTRLKVLEAMGNKVAMVSTTVGAEGIGYTDRVDIMIADDPALFAGRTLELLKDPAKAGDIAVRAFDLVRNTYEWNIIGNKMAQYFEAPEIHTPT